MVAVHVQGKPAPGAPFMPARPVVQVEGETESSAQGSLEELSRHPGALARGEGVEPSGGMTAGPRSEEGLLGGSGLGQYGSLAKVTVA